MVFMAKAKARNFQDQDQSHAFFVLDIQGQS